MTDDELVALAEDLRKKSQEYKGRPLYDRSGVPTGQSYRDWWNLAWSYYNGDLAKPKIQEDVGQVPYIPANLYLAVKDAEIPLLQSPRPRIIVTIDNKQDDPLAREVHLVTQALWNRYIFGQATDEHAFYVALFNCAGFKLDYDAQFQRPILYALDPAIIDVMPGVGDIASSPYVIQTNKITGWRLNVIYPGSLKELAPNMSVERAMYENFTVSENWLLDDDGKNGKRFATSNGKLISPVTGFNLPFEGYPYAWTSYPRHSVDIWRFSDLKHIKVLLDEWMVALGSLFTYVNKFANPPLLARTGSGVMDKMRNLPGQIVATDSPTTDAFPLQVGNMPQHAAEAIQVVPKLVELILNLPPATRGVKPGSVTATSALDLLFELGTVKIKRIYETIADSLTIIGQKLVQMIQRVYYSEGGISRRFALTGDEARIAQELGLPPEVITRFDEKIANAVFEVQVDKESIAFLSEAAKRQLVVQLAQLGVIQDVNLILELLRFPGWRDIMDRQPNAMVNPQVTQQLMQILQGAGGNGQQPAQPQVPNIFGG